MSEMRRYQTRLDLSIEQAALLDAYAALYGKAERSLFARLSVQDFKNGQYDAAISEFERAKERHGKSADERVSTEIAARLYFATAYAAQFIPGAPSEANQEWGRKAVEEFQGVHEIDPET
jgi:hypothetical protein